MTSSRLSFVLLCCLFLPACTSLAQQSSSGEEATLPEAFDDPIPLYENALGDYHYPISSENPEAQAYYGQGVQMMYAFAKEDAARSFRAAWQADSTCAICYWGEAWAWGPYLNGRMRTREAPHAYAALQKALAHRRYANDKERALIDAMALRYVADYDPDQQAARDTVYAEALRHVRDQYPDDLDIATLYAESLFLLEPRLGTRDLADPDVQRLHQALEAILDRDLRHPGACHLYIHATESTTAPEKAEPCAEYLGDAIPGASHINHMPSHTWNEIGRWGDAVRANIQAWHSDQKAAIDEGFAIYPSHNLHMLLFAASMDGQGATAVQAGRDYAKLTGNNMYHVLTLLRFGRFDEILEVEARPERDIPRGMWDFAQGYAHLRQGEADFARVYLERVKAMADTSKSRFRFHPAQPLLATVAGILEGEIHRDAGDLDGAIAAFERAVVAEDTLQYDEPEPLPFAARHWLGAALLEAERYAEAAAVYRAALEDHPHNGWSLFGLRQALAALGQEDAAVDADWQESWARADIWLRASRF